MEIINTFGFGPAIPTPAPTRPVNDGGPAFPNPGFIYPNGEHAHPDGGMTLRDYFAGQALAGILSQPGSCSIGYTELNAEVAYANADAMLAARGAP